MLVSLLRAMCTLNWELYDGISDAYERCRKSIGTDKILEEIMSITGKQPKELHVLDAGCGTGNYSHALLEAGIGRISTVDASAGMLKHAVKNLSSFGERIGDTKLGRLPVIPYDNAMFDAVMLNWVLHHLDENVQEFPEVKETIKEAKRVLVPNGALCIITSFPEQLDGIWFFNLSKAALDRYKERFPTRHMLRKMLEDAGFSIVNEVPIIGSDWSSLYWDEKGPLDKTFRDHDEFWAITTECELNAAGAMVKEMKANGSMHQYMIDNDSSRTSGHMTLISTVLCATK